MAKAKDLAQIIRDNPGCVAIIDNDCWSLHREHPDKNPNDWSDNERACERWDEDNLLADDGDTFDPHLGDGGYGSGNCYGGDILQALAQIVGITVESV